MGFLRSFERGDWTVLVEDDDRVAYAYLLDHGRITADVWLYNRVPAPQQPPRQQPGREMPFLNSAHHVDDNNAMRSPPSACPGRIPPNPTYGSPSTSTTSL